MHFYGDNKLSSAICPGERTGTQRPEKMADCPVDLFSKLSISTKNKPCERDAEDTVIFKQHDLPSSAFPMISDIRRQGKLCDVTLKVRHEMLNFKVLIRAPFITSSSSAFPTYISWVYNF